MYSYMQDSYHLYLLFHSFKFKYAKCLDTYLKFWIVIHYYSYHTNIRQKSVIDKTDQCKINPQILRGNVSMLLSLEHFR